MTGFGLLVECLAFRSGNISERARGVSLSEFAYDAVVIGSGLGGLTAAALLAKSGRKHIVRDRRTD